MVDLGEFAAMNEIYASYFAAPYPARSTVQVVKLPRDVRVEIDVIASWIDVRALGGSELANIYH